MKKISWILIITILVVGGIHAVTAKQSSGITGTVSPAEPGNSSIGNRQQRYH